MAETLVRLFAPKHAGRSINATLANGKKITVVFDDEGFADLSEDEAQHMVACGSGLIQLVTSELLAEVKEQEEEEQLTYMQKWKMKMQEEVPDAEGQAKKDRKEAKSTGTEKTTKSAKTGKKGKVKVKTKAKKIRTTL